MTCLWFVLLVRSLLAEDDSPHYPDRKTDNTSGQWILLGVDIRFIFASFFSYILSILPQISSPFLLFDLLIQFEYVSQHLVFANCIPLILKFFNQNILSYITAKNRYGSGQVYFKGLIWNGWENYIVSEPFSSGILYPFYLKAVAVKFNFREVLADGAYGLASSQRHLHFKSFESQKIS